MAFSFDEIMTRMLARVPNSMDKREGSIIWDALAPAAYELSLAYDEMDLLYANTFVATADRDGLVRRAAEYNVVPLPATKAVRRGFFTPASIDVPIGERFNCGEQNFAVTEKLAAGEYALECETPGAAGNIAKGSMLPIGYVEGLETATMAAEPITYGEEIEDTEDFRQRFLAVLRGDAKDGNVAQYKLWASTFPGVGKAKVFSLWNGSNTVKVSILNSESLPASGELIADFQDFLDPGAQGVGNGEAPIGAIVTVSTASVVPLNITASASLTKGYYQVDGVEEAVKEYLAKIAYTKNNVPYMGVGAVIQNCECIDFLTDFRINGGIVDIMLGAEQIGVLNSINIEVV